MIDPALFPLFLAGALLLNVTPGPDMAFTLASATRGGSKTGIAAAIGVGAGSIVWAGLTACGLAALLAASDHAFSVVKTIGGVYLLYLAWRAYRTRKDFKSVDGAGDLAGAFRSGALTNLLNPKVGLFYLAFLPSFTSPEIGPVWLQTLTLGAIFSLSGAVVLVGVALAAGAVRNRLAASVRLRSGLSLFAATMFGALGLRLIFVADR